MTYREFWLAVFLAKSAAGISAAKSAEIADDAVKQLKVRDTSVDYDRTGWFADHSGETTI